MLPRRLLFEYGIDRLHREFFKLQDAMSDCLIWELGLYDNRKTYVSITINNKSYFISINDNVLIMIFALKWFF